MKVELIEVGKTYVGRKGKPRTVVSIDMKSEVHYHSGNPAVTKHCWKWTFGSWAIGEQKITQDQERDKRIRDAAHEMLEALKKAEIGLVNCLPTAGFDMTTLAAVRTAIARAEGASYVG